MFGYEEEDESYSMTSSLEMLTKKLAKEAGYREKLISDVLARVQNELDSARRTEVSVDTMNEPGYDYKAHNRSFGKVLERVSDNPLEFVQSLHDLNYDMHLFVKYVLEKDEIKQIVSDALSALKTDEGAIRERSKELLA